MKRFVKIISIVLALVCVSACFVSCTSKEKKAENAEIIAKAEAAGASEIKEYINALNADDFKKSKKETNYVMFDISGYGKIVVALRPDIAPISAANFKKLVSEKFYDGLVFHRVIKDFMIQGGDPEGTGMGGAKDKIKGEFSVNGWNNPISHKRGVISMARSQNYNSASSQFFICHADATFLDGQYAAFGAVVVDVYLPGAGNKFLIAVRVEYYEVFRTVPDGQISVRVVCQGIFIGYQSVALLFCEIAGTPVGGMVRQQSNIPFRMLERKAQNAFKPLTIRFRVGIEKNGDVEISFAFSHSRLKFSKLMTQKQASAVAKLGIFN